MPRARPSVGGLAFRAELYRVGINFCVDVPSTVSTALGGAPHIPVRGTAAGQPFRGTLVPRGGGRHRLFLDGRVRKAAGIAAGDAVSITLERGDWLATDDVPGDLRERLAASDDLEAFAALPPGLRQEMLTWLGRAKRPETREGRLDRIQDEVRRRRTI